MANNKKNTKAAKSSTPAVKKKKFFLVRWWEFALASVAELKKVSWPTKKELFKGTWVTILIIAVFAVVIAALDILFSTVTNLFYNLM